MIKVQRVQEKGVSIISLQRSIIINQKEVDEFVKKLNDLISCYDLSDIIKKYNKEITFVEKVN